MKYQSIITLLENKSNQPFKLRTKNCVEINDESRETYNINSQIKFKTAMLKSSLGDHNDAYILAKGTITVNNAASAGADVNNVKLCTIYWLQKWNKQRKNR